MALTEHPELIESFEQLGLSPNEAKVYLALLENHPITGYQLSKISGILRPVVYEMLNRLVEKGGARIVKSNPDTYVPVEINEFLRNIETNFTEAKKNISVTLKKFLQVDDSDFFWNVLGKKNIVNSVLEMLERGESEILGIFQNQDLFDLVGEALTESMNRGVSINLFSYFALNTGDIPIYTYQLDTKLPLEGVSPDIFAIVIDEKEALLANITDEKTGKAVTSKNPAVVETLRQHIMNQIYLIRLWKIQGSDKIKMMMNNRDRKLLETIDKYLQGKLF